MFFPQGHLEGSSGAIIRSYYQVHFSYSPKGEHIVAAVSVRLSVHPSVRNTFLWSILLDVCRVPKCPTALNVRQILFFSKSVILVTKININSKISKYFKKIISEKYSESNLEKKLPDI